MRVRYTMSRGIEMTAAAQGILPKGIRDPRLLQRGQHLGRILWMQPAEENLVAATKRQ